MDEQSYSPIPLDINTYAFSDPDVPTIVIYVIKSHINTCKYKIIIIVIIIQMTHFIK